MHKTSKRAAVVCLALLVILAVVLLKSQNGGETNGSSVGLQPVPEPQDAPPEPAGSPGTEAERAVRSEKTTPSVAAQSLVAPEKVAEPDKAAVLPKSQPKPQPQPPVTKEAPPPRTVPPFAQSEAVLAQEAIKIDPPMSEIGRSWTEEGGQRYNFSMPVTGGRDLEVEVDRFIAIGQDGGEFIGRVKGKPESSVRLSYRGGAEAGTIQLPSENKSYRVLPNQGKEVVVQERDLRMDESAASMPPGDVAIPPVPEFTPPPPPGEMMDSLDAPPAQE